MSANTSPIISFPLRIAMQTLTLLLVFTLATSVSAKITTWTNQTPVNDLWSHPVNWSNGVPENHDDVYFMHIGGTSTMDLDNLTLNALVMTGYTGTLYVAHEFGTFTIYNMLVDSVLELGTQAMQVETELRVEGELRIFGGTLTIPGTTEVSGLLQASNAILEFWGDLTAMPGSVFELGSSQVLAYLNIFLQDAAQLSWTSGQLNCTGGFTQEVHLGPNSNVIGNVVIDKSLPISEVSIMSTDDVMSLGELNVEQGIVELQPRHVNFHEIDIDNGGTVRGASEDSQVDITNSLTIRGVFENTQPGFTMRLGPGVPIDILDNGRFTIIGDPADPSILEQDGVAGGPQWTITYNRPATTVDLENVRVQDSNANGTPTPLDAPGAQDGGNNDNWDFGGPHKITGWVGGGATDQWSDHFNWDLGAPVTGDGATFNTSEGVLALAIQDIPGLSLSSMDLTGFQGQVVLQESLEIVNDLRVEGSLEAAGQPLVVGGILEVAGSITGEGTPVTVGSNLHVDGGSIVLRQDFDLEVIGNLDGMHDASLHLDAGRFAIHGDLSLDNFGPIDLSNTVLEFRGDMDQRATFLPDDQRPGEILVNKLGTTKVRLDGPLDINGDVTIHGGHLELSGQITVRGTTVIESEGVLLGVEPDGIYIFHDRIEIQGGRFEMSNYPFRLSFPTGRAVELSGPAVFEINGGPPGGDSRLVQDGTQGGLQWNIAFDSESTISVTGVDVQDSNAQGPSPIEAPDATDGGNNTNWDFYESAANDDTPPPMQLQVTAAPNPFNPVTTICFDIPTDGPASLLIYNVNGALVRTLVDDQRERGQYRISWDGCNDDGRIVGAGAYFARLASQDGVEVVKMVLLK